MPYGYSNNMAVQIAEKHAQEPTDPLFAMSAICVRHNILPSMIANKLGVSKQTIYDWLSGKYAPRPDKEVDIKKYLKELRKKYPEKG